MTIHPDDWTTAAMELDECRRRNRENIITDNTKAAALLAVRVRELEKQLGVMRYCISMENGKPEIINSTRLREAISAYDAVRGK